MLTKDVLKRTSRRRTARRISMNREARRYLVVQSTSVQRLVTKITGLIDNRSGDPYDDSGYYRLHGGVAFDGKNYLQALVHEYWEFDAKPVEVKKATVSSKRKR